MCTVTFILQKDKVFITSNRDEHFSRNARLKPTEEVIHKRVVYPKDIGAGGTWFAMNESGYVTVLLNGAFKNHKRNPPYRKSRGLIVLEIIAHESPMTFLDEIDLVNIEPFTLVVFGNSKLYEFRWNGEEKYKKQLNVLHAHIWSSYTLYDEIAQAKRDQYFKEFIGLYEDFDSGKILNFHQENHGDFENGFIVDRKNGLKTLSLTQVVINDINSTLTHYDLDSGEKESATITLTPLLSSHS